MTAEGYAYEYDNNMNLYATSLDEETGEGVWINCYYYGDLKTMEFDSSTCQMDVYGPDYEILFNCYDGECEEVTYEVEFTDEEYFADPAEDYAAT
jgi:hypothetical protein